MTDNDSMNDSMVDAIVHWASEDPNRIALRYGEVTRTWKELVDRTAATAGALTDLGVGRGARVVLMDQNHPAYLELALGCAWIGAVLVPVNPRLTAKEVVHIVADTGADVMFTGGSAATAAELMPQLTRIISLESDYEPLLAGAEPVRARRPAAGDPFLQLYTSGTTGFPKGAVLTHGNVVAMSRSVTARNGLTREGVSLVAMPLFHIAGLSQAMLTFHVGATVVLVREPHPDGLLDTIELHRPTHTFLVPTVLTAMLDRPGARARNLSSLTGLTYGAAPMPVALVERARDTFKADFHQMYGCTEATGALTLLGAAEHRDPVRTGRLASAGLPLPGVELQVVDPETGNLRRPGDVGEVRVRGPQVMDGYWRAPQATDEALTGDGWLRTGDAGYVDDDGYLYLVDRMKDLIVSGGENVYPAEIERVLGEHVAVAEVAVIGVPDPQWGEVGAAYVVPVPDVAADADLLMAFCRSRLAGFKCPKSILFVGQLPRNTNGKVLRRTLRDQHWQHLDRRI